MSLAIEVHVQAGPRGSSGTTSALASVPSRASWTSESKRPEIQQFVFVAVRPSAKQTRVPHPTLYARLQRQYALSVCRLADGRGAGHSGDDGAGVLLEMVPSASPAARPQCPEFTAERRRRQM